MTRAQRNAEIVEAVELRKETLDAIASRYGITRQRVHQIAKHRGCTMRGRHHPAFRGEEKAKLADLYFRGMPIAHAAATIGRSPSGVMEYLVRSGLHTPENDDQAWSQSEDAVVLREYPKAQAGITRVRDIAERLGRTKNEVIGRANRLGLQKKGATYVARKAQCRAEARAS